MQNKILIVDDNPEIREVVNVLLSNEGYQIEESDNGITAIDKCKDADLIILDIMMPEMDGFHVCRKIREITNAPILFLTARTMDQDKALGFSSGGDDYMAKPFSYNELITRVKALLRRYTVYKGKQVVEEGNMIITHNLKIHKESNQVYIDNERIQLTEIEYRILLLLAGNPKKLYSNQELYEHIWEDTYMYTANNTIMVHIRNLRKKLGVDPQKPIYIKTVWGKGYRFD